MSSMVDTPGMNHSVAHSVLVGPCHFLIWLPATHELMILLYIFHGKIKALIRYKKIKIQKCARYIEQNKKTKSNNYFENETQKQI